MMTAVRTLLLVGLGFAEAFVLAAIYFWYCMRQDAAGGAAASGVNGLVARTFYNPTYWIILLVLLAITAWRGLLPAH